MASAPHRPRSRRDTRAPRPVFGFPVSLRALHPGRTGCRAALAPEAGEGTSEASKPCAAGSGGCPGRGVLQATGSPRRAAPACDSCRRAGRLRPARLGAFTGPPTGKAAVLRAIRTRCQRPTNAALIDVYYLSHAFPLQMNHQHKNPTRPPTTTTTATDMPAMAPEERLGSLLPAVLSFTR